MVAKHEYFSSTQAPAKVPLWREAIGGLDWLMLHSSPVYYGLGVPCGDKSPVVVVPGFLATDFYLQELYYWLFRVGYRPYMSKIGRNADCLDTLYEKLAKTVNQAHQETGRKVHLIGHNLGGVLSLSLVPRMSDKIASVITMGSPIRGIRSHPLVLQAGNRVRQRIFLEGKNKAPGCFSGQCDCKPVSSLQSGLPNQVPLTAIYTKTDGVVDWKYCISKKAEDNIEVKGTHIGLAFNPAVYSIIAKNLSGKGKTL